jgi:hypothetical protein
MTSRYTYTIPRKLETSLGEVAQIRNHYNELAVTLKERTDKS